jgi:hypothetical protein
MKMDARITIALPDHFKTQLDDLALRSSVSEGKNVTSGELIRRSLAQTYEFDSSVKRSNARQKKVKNKGTRQRSKR